MRSAEITSYKPTYVARHIRSPIATSPHLPQTPASSFNASRCIESAQTHRARVRSLLTRASDTTLRLPITDLAPLPGRRLSYNLVLRFPQAHFGFLAARLFAGGCRRIS